MPTESREPVPLHLRRLGRGEPTLLLHGFTGSSRAWPERCIEALAAEHELLIPDLPGHGNSPPPPPTARDLPATVDALVQLLDRIGVAGATWIGYSMGGRVALGAAVLRPNRVHRLVLESASPGLSSPEERTLRRERDRALADRIEAEGVAAFTDAWMAQPLFATQRQLPEAVQAAERDRRLENSARGLAASLRGIGTGEQPSFWDDLGGVSSPALMITGSLDPKFTRLAATMKNRLPEAHHVTVAGAGHAVHLERPDLWCRAVADFLA